MRRIIPTAVGSISFTRLYSWPPLGGCLYEGCVEYTLFMFPAPPDKHSRWKSLAACRPALHRVTPRAAHRLMLKMAGRWEKREEEMEPPSGFHRRSLGIPGFNVWKTQPLFTPPPHPPLCRVCFS